jgi:beta-glucanase (GH16 family)
MRIRGALLWLFIILPLARLEPGAQQAAPGPSTHSGWVLAWSDEFNGPDGSEPDPSKWIVERGGNGWGNHELEYYTARRQNVRQENGNLVITAIKERFTGPDGVQRDYTSGRLNTGGRFSQRYGRFEARIQVPSGEGLWPAFWLLGSDFFSLGWPACGEIDVMENRGSEPATIYGSLHGPGYSRENPVIAAFTAPAGRFSDQFHIFAIEWEPQLIRFFVDDNLYASKTTADLPAGKPWVYDHAVFILLSLAVGGDFPGRPNDSTSFPQRMLVDYVRVYTRK